MWQNQLNPWNLKRKLLAISILFASVCMVFQVNIPTASAQSAAVNNAVLITKTSPSLGNYLADPSSKALYTYNGDTSGVSNCTGGCLAEWPAYQDIGSTSGLPANVGTIKRSDNGQIQYTYQGLPLYYFVNDSGGNVTGNGVDNFKLAVPAAAVAPQSAPASSQPAASALQQAQATKPATKLPTTGPAGIPTQLLALGLLTVAIVGYQRSRRPSNMPHN